MSPAMSRVGALLWLMLVGLLGPGSAASETRIEVTASQRKALGIELGRPEPRPLIPRADLPGRILLPNDRLHVVTARSEGVLLQPSVAVGDRVEPGQALARIASPGFVALQREYLEALSQRDLSRATADREAELAREGIIAGRRALESAAALREVQARVAQARQSLVLSGMRDPEIAALERTRRLETDLVLRAPFAAVVLEQYAQAGERLGAGGAVYRLGDPSALAVEIHVPLETARTLRVGARIWISEGAATGSVTAVGSEVHSADQGIVVRATVLPGELALRPGQFVSVEIETAKDRGPAFAVPAAAVVHAQDRAWVFVQQQDGFVPVPVEIVGGAGRERLVVGPLQAQTELAIRGTSALKALWLSAGGPP